MRICYISPDGYGLFNKAYTQKQHYAGSEVGVYTESKELARDLSYDVHMLIDADQDFVFKKHAITIHTISGSFHTKNIFKKIKYHYDFLQKISRINADVYIVRAAPTEIYLLTGVYCRLRHKRFIRVLGTPPRKNVPAYDILRWVRWNIIAPATLCLANSIIALTKQQASELSLSNRAKTHVIGLSKEISSPKKTRRTYVLWAAHPSIRKRPNLFLKIAESLPRYKFMMLVQGELYLPKISNVTVRSYVPHTQIDRYFSKACVFVHTSQEDVSGNVLAEAWKNGTPTVSTIDPDEVICTHQLGYHAHTLDEMIKHTKKLLDNKKTWKKQSENAYQFALRNHDVTKQMAKYKKLFNTL